VQVDPVNPTLKAPGTKRLKLKCDEPLSKITFKFHLCRYAEAVDKYAALANPPPPPSSPPAPRPINPYSPG